MDQHDSHNDHEHHHVHNDSHLHSHINASQDDQDVCWYRGGPFASELTSHLPFSILSVALGLMLAGVICFLTTDDNMQAAEKVATLHHHHGHDDGADHHEHQGHDDHQAVSDLHDEHDAHQHNHNESADHHSEHEHHAAGVTSTESSEQGHTHGHTMSGFTVLFHLFHPAHMLFSAAATAAMFWRYERNILKAILVGMTGAIVVCGISDIVMPHLSATIMHKQIAWHVCIIEHPLMVLPFATIGVLIGIVAASNMAIKSTIFSHSLHVFTSTMASIFYLIGAFGRLEWINDIGIIFFFICLAVMIPCCLSDIVYPLLFTKRARQVFAESGGHAH